MFGCNGKFHFPEIHFLLTNIYSFDPEIILHSYFQFKSFPEKERERERKKREPRSERERGRRESRRDPPTSEKKQNGDRRAARSSNKRARRMIAPLIGRSRPSSIAIASALVDRRAARSSDERARRSRSSIAPRVGRSYRSRLRSRQGPRDLIFSSAAPSFSSDLACTDLMNFFAGFCFFYE